MKQAKALSADTRAFESDNPADSSVKWITKCIKCSTTLKTMSGRMRKRNANASISSHLRSNSFLFDTLQRQILVGKTQGTRKDDQPSLCNDAMGGNKSATSQIWIRSSEGRL